MLSFPPFPPYPCVTHSHEHNEPSLAAVLTRPFSLLAPIPLPLSRCWCCTLSLARRVNHADQCIELVVATNNDSVVKSVLVFDFDGGMFEGECLMVNPAAASSTVSVPLRPPRDKPVELTVHAFVGARLNSIQYHVFELKQRLPKFAMFALAQGGGVPEVRGRSPRCSASKQAPVYRVASPPTIISSPRSWSQWSLSPGNEAFCWPSLACTPGQWLGFPDTLTFVLFRPTHPANPVPSRNRQSRSTSQRG